MVNFRIATAFFLGTLFVVAPAGAQNRISVSSAFLAAGAALPRNCMDQAKVLGRELDSFPLLPARWHWIVVCDDASWESLLRKSGHIGSPQRTTRVFDERLDEIIYASTELDAGTTVLRGTTLLNPDNPLAHPDHVIAHELAHIVLHTRDEARAEALALIWLQQREGGHLAWLRDPVARSGDGTARQARLDRPPRGQ